MPRRVALTLLVALLLAPVAASSGGWVLRTYYPYNPTMGIYVAAADITGLGGRPAAVVFDAWGTRVFWSPDPLGGVAFTQVPITVPSHGVATMRLGLSADGTPHVFALRDTGYAYTLAYATKGRYWSFESVTSGHTSADFRLHDVAVDASSQPHALVTVASSDVLFSRIAGAWTARVLGPSMTTPHLGSSPAGTLHVCRGTPHGLVHAWGSALGAWSEEVVQAGAFSARSCSIVARSDADVRIAFETGGVVEHATRTTTGWSVGTVPTPAAGPDASVVRVSHDGTGAPFVAVRAPSYGVRLYGAAGGAWVEESPPGLLAERTDPFLVPGVAKPYVATGSGQLLVWSWE